ncbi:DsbA family protein [Pseudooceanicola sp. 502str34]
MDRRIFIAAGGAAVAAAGGVWYGLTRGGDTGVTQIAAAQNETPDDIDTSSIVEMVQGDPNAPVTLMEYASFTCPHCANFHAGPYKQLKAEYIDTGKVKFIYRDVYFDKYGLWAAMIARCTGPMRFFGISDMLFDRQKEWLAADTEAGIANNLRNIGKVAGLDNDTIEACLADDQKARELVAWYQKNATADEVNATPTLFINGVKHSNMNYAELKKLIDEALAG